MILSAPTFDASLGNLDALRASHLATQDDRFPKDASNSGPINHKSLAGSKNLPGVKIKVKCFCIVGEWFQLPIHYCLSVE